MFKWLFLERPRLMEKYTLDSGPMQWHYEVYECSTKEAAISFLEKQLGWVRGMAVSTRAIIVKTPKGCWGKGFDRIKDETIYEVELDPYLVVNGKKGTWKRLSDPPSVRPV